MAVPTRVRLAVVQKRRGAVLLPSAGPLPLSLHSEVPPTSLCLSVLALVGVPPPFWGERPACPELSL